MGGGQSIILQGEDIKDKYDAGDIDLSSTCKEDVICPPAKYMSISKFTNKRDNNKSNFKYILIFLLLLLFLLSIIKYI